MRAQTRGLWHVTRSVVEQALAASGYSEVVSTASMAYRQDVSYAEAVLAAATKAQLKREAWANRMGNSSPTVKTLKVPVEKALFSFDDLEDVG
jgi:hypothetical protein